MEAHTEAQGDPFATTPGDGDDPFATQPAVEAEIEAEVAPPPVVDREGQPVEGEPVETEALPEATTATPEEAETQPEAVPAEGGEGAPPQEPPAAPAEAPEPPEATAAPENAGDGAQAAQEGGDGGEQQADGPKGVLRYYKVLYQTDTRQWTEAELDENDPDVVRLAKKDGGDDALWIAARNNEHAVRLAWKVLGTPSGGVTAFPVPKGAWKPKRIKPAAPRPERERLEIS